MNHVEPAVLTGLLDALDGFECHQNVARQDAGNPENGGKGTTDRESHATYDNGPDRQSPIRRKFLLCMSGHSSAPVHHVLLDTARRNVPCRHLARC